LVPYKQSSEILGFAALIATDSNSPDHPRPKNPRELVFSLGYLPTQISYRKSRLNQRPSKETKVLIPTANTRRKSKSKWLGTLGLVGTGLLAFPSANAAVIKKGGACPKAQVDQTVIGPRNTPYICTKVKTKYVWKLTSAGDGTAVEVTSSKLPPALAGTFSMTNPLGTFKGTMWWGLSQGDLESAYYNESTIVWQFTAPDGCALNGVAEGVGQLAVYDKVTRYNLTLLPALTLVCPSGTKVVNTSRSSPQLMLKTGGLATEMTYSAKAENNGGTIIGVLGTPAGVSSTIVSKTAENPFTAEFTLAPSTREARPPKA
jgi:hypothetical protein